MSLLVTGTIGIDTVETPSGRADGVLGGSAVYFAFAASLIHPVRLVGVVGDDFPEAFRAVFTGHPIDTSGLETRAGSKTFRWHGKYLQDWNERESLSTDLNVIAEAPPRIPDALRDAAYVFLANTHPAVQREFLGQLTSPKLVVCDTMDLWINDFRDDLLRTLQGVDGVVLNDGEARMLTGKSDLIEAGRNVLRHVRRFVVVKKGEHGAMLITPDDIVVVPAFPTQAVQDPTGAGDAFAGGMMAYLASVDRVDTTALKTAIAYGTCTASITIEDFSLASIRKADANLLKTRLDQFKAMLMFD